MSSTSTVLQTEKAAEECSKESSTAGADKRLLIWMGLAALAVRLGYIVFFHSYQMNQVFNSFGLPEGIPHFFFGYEAGSIARSIAAIRVCG